MDIFWSILSVVAAIAFLVFIAMAVYFWWRRTRFTRDRFAFTAFSSCVTVTCLTIGAIVGGGPPWEQLITLIHFVKTGEVQSTSLDATTSAILVVLCFGLYSLMSVVFRAWDGQVSKATYDAREARNDHHIATEAIDELKRMLRRGTPSAPYKPPTSSPALPDLGTPEPLAPWSEQAAKLLPLWRNAYEFHDWRTEHKFWVVHHTDFGHNLAVQCVVDPPSDESLQGLIRYAAQMQPPPAEFLVVVQSDYPSESRTVDGQTIEVVSRAELLQKIVSFSEYRQSIRERVTILELPDSEVTLHDTYVPPRMTHEDDHTKSVDCEEELLKWLRNSGGKQVALLGEYGQGKSTVALMLTKRLLEDPPSGIDRIPVLIELRGKSPSTMNRGELLGAWGDRYGIGSRQLKALHDAGRLLLIFDGFDEMALVGNPVERLQHFQTLWSFNHSKAKLIFTGRPNLFLDDNELRAALGIRHGSAGKLMCEAWRLEKFNDDEIARALRNATPAVRDGIVSAVMANPRLRDIASRPSLLHVISVLWTEPDFARRAAELSSADVMERFVTASIRRQSEKALDQQGAETDDNSNKRQPRNYMVLNSAERQYFMRGIAVYMMKSGETNQIRSQELTDISDRLAAVCPASVSMCADGVVDIPRAPLTQRLADSEDFRGRMHDDIRTCGLLVSDISTHGLRAVDDKDSAFKFGHKSFMEFLAADFAERSHAEDEDDESDAIQPLLNVSFQDVLRNDVTLRYFGELIISRRAALGSLASGVATANQLVTHIIRPRRLQRTIMKIAARSIRAHPDSSHFPATLPFLYRHLQYPLAAGYLVRFVRSRSDRWEIQRNAMRLVIAVVLSAMVLFYALLFISSYSAVESTNKATFLIPASFLFVIISTFTVLLRFLFRLHPTTIDAGSLERVWNIVCVERGCGAQDLYAALASLDVPRAEWNDDPIGLLVSRLIDRDNLVNQSDGMLRSYIAEASKASNRNLAALVLAERYSPVAAAVFSRDHDGSQPARDIRTPLDDDTLQSLCEVRQLSPEALEDQLAMLSQFMGWDVKAGWSETKAS